MDVLQKQEAKDREFIENMAEKIEQDEKFQVDKFNQILNDKDA